MHELASNHVKDKKKKKKKGKKSKKSKGKKELTAAQKEKEEKRALEKKAKEAKREKDKAEKETLGKAKKASSFWGCEGEDGNAIRNFDVFGLDCVCDILAVVSLNTTLTFASSIRARANTSIISCFLVSNPFPFSEKRAMLVARCFA